ncbi:MAG: C40 family peptidase [Pararhodobacter sp.]|nr:C40 family peptidase [Pararhodobacter sp.]
MTDRRFLPAWGEVAHVSLRGQHQARVFTEGRRYRIATPLVDLRAAPGGARDRQLLTGAPFLALLWQGDGVFGRHEVDGYCGWIDAAALAPDGDWTHHLAVPASHLYPDPDIKSAARAALYMGARLAVTEQVGAMARSPAGWVPMRHLRPRGHHATDPVAVARGFLGAPYLWGGNSWAGIDCSGLVQAAFLACGLPCAADSDLQRRMPGKPVRAETARPGDLAFWPGHVALVSGPDRIIHANAHHMAVVEEPFSTAAQRIRETGGPEAVVHRILLQTSRETD